MRTVLHCDMNNYFASVETVAKPGLAKVPMAVCGDPRLRHGIVLAKNELAKKFGVTTGEPTGMARMKCPGLVVVPPHYDKYCEYTGRTREIFRRFSTEVYPYGMDEAWLVLPEGVPAKAGVLVADEIRRVISEELSITASVGVSFNYVFAKLASDIKKPNATTHLSLERMKEDIWSRPCEELLFVGAVTHKTLRQVGIRTIGDIALSDVSFMRDILGKNGETLWRFANGDDSSFDPSTDTESEPGSIGNSMTAPRDIRTPADASAFLYLLSGSVERRMSRLGMKCGCVSINVRREDFVRYSRQVTLPSPTGMRGRIFRAAEELLMKHHDWRYGIRSIGIRIEKLSGTHGEQISMFPEEDEVPEIAATAAARIREGYGVAVG